MSALTNIFTSTYMNILLLQLFKMAAFHVDTTLKPGITSVPCRLHNPVFYMGYIALHIETVDKCFLTKVVDTKGIFFSMSRFWFRDNDLYVLKCPFCGIYTRVRVICSAHCRHYSCMK
jgi:hypothetical protein